MGLKKRAPIDTYDDHGNLYQRRFRYCGDVETYCGSKGEEYLHEKWVARNNTTRTYSGSRRGEESLSAVYYPDGKAMLYTGPRGEERLYQIYYPEDKTIEHYHGARGRERVLYTCTEAEEKAMDDSDDETPIEWRTLRTAEECEQRERMRQAVIERRQDSLREALKTCTDPREFLCNAVAGEEVRSVLKENAANVLIDKIYAIKPRITGDEYAEIANALEAYFALVR
tara:strand:- start:514 stop:1194 length:681 start_codon:yes stop_codon:yes gene_type:complete